MVARRCRCGSVVLTGALGWPAAIALCSSGPSEARALAARRSVVAVRVPAPGGPRIGKQPRAQLPYRPCLGLFGLRICTCPGCVVRTRSFGSGIMAGQIGQLAAELSGGEAEEIERPWAERRTLADRAGSWHSGARLRPVPSGPRRDTHGSSCWPAARGDRCTFEQGGAGRFIAVLQAVYDALNHGRPACIGSA